jgi:hypothetical protein
MDGQQPNDLDGHNEKLTSLILGFMLSSFRQAIPGCCKYLPNLATPSHIPHNSLSNYFHLSSPIEIDYSSIAKLRLPYLSSINLVVFRQLSRRIVLYCRAYMVMVDILVRELNRESSEKLPNPLLLISLAASGPGFLRILAALLIGNGNACVGILTSDAARLIILMGDAPFLFGSWGNSILHFCGEDFGVGQVEVPLRWIFVVTDKLIGSLQTCLKFNSIQREERKLCNRLLAFASHLAVRSCNPIYEYVPLNNQAKLILPVSG